MNLNNYIKSRIVVIVFTIFIATTVTSQNVNYATASKLAGLFFSAQNKWLNNAMTLAMVNINKNDTLFYVFNNGNSGFVLVSGDYSVYPVLGYSNEGKFIVTNQSEVSYWLNKYAKQISDIKLNKKNVTENPAWNKFLTNGFAKTIKSLNNGVNYFVTTKWDQGPYYDLYCPAASDGEAGHCVTGCVATAMAQVMKYFNYPPKGNGSNTYVHSHYGVLSVNFSDVTYDWADMTNTVNGNSSQNTINAVATLIYDCGVQVDMDYTPVGSGSSCYIAANSFIQYFGYRNTIANIPRDSSAFMGKANDPKWKLLLTNNLQLHQPILYSGADDTVGGHAFVCDGYQTDALDSIYFHMNWGWSGGDDGYYLLDNLDPGADNFTAGEAAIVNIAPYGAEYCTAKMIYTAQTAEINNGSGQSNYWANTNCDWLIEPPDAQQIVLQFNSFKTRHDSDWVTVYDGDTTTAKVLGAFSGDSIPPNITAKSGKMLITFTSIGQDPGWDATYYTTATGINQLTNSNRPINSISKSCDRRCEFVYKFRL